MVSIWSLPENAYFSRFSVILGGEDGVFSLVMVTMNPPAASCGELNPKRLK